MPNRQNNYAMTTGTKPQELACRSISMATSFEELYHSMKKCRCGVGWKDSVAHFTLNALEQVIKLEQELNDGTYKQRPTKHFQITSPKPRDVVSVGFRDRVYQRSINDNILYPATTRSFIYDNWACQKGKGTTKCRDRLKEHLRRYYRKHGHEGFVAQFDIHGYYPNMRHDVVEGYFRRKLSDDEFQAVRSILQNQYHGDVGYNPGSQMVQIAGISVLDPLDHYIKEQLHIKHYLRYMDDFILIHEDEAYLQDCYQRVEEFLHKIGFSLNTKKSRIYPLSQGILFLGFIFHLTRTGRVIVFVDPVNIKRNRRKYRRLVNKIRKNNETRVSADTSWLCWISHISYSSFGSQPTELKDFYKTLWRDDID